MKMINYIYKLNPKDYNPNYDSLEFDCFNNIGKPYDDFNYVSLLDEDLSNKLLFEIIKNMYNEQYYEYSYIYDMGGLIPPIYEFNINYKDEEYTIKVFGRYIHCYKYFGEERDYNFKTMNDPQIGDHYYSLKIRKDGRTVLFAAW